MEAQASPQVKEPMVMEPDQIDQPPMTMDRPDWVQERPPVGESDESTEEPVLATWPNEELQDSSDAPPITESPINPPMAPTEEQLAEKEAAEDAAPASGDVGNSDNADTAPDTAPNGSAALP